MFALHGLEAMSFTPSFLEGKPCPSNYKFDILSYELEVESICAGELGGRQAVQADGGNDREAKRISMNLI